MLGPRDRISLSRSFGSGWLFAHAQRAAVLRLQTNRTAKPPSLRQGVSSVALSHFQQTATLLDTSLYPRGRTSSTKHPCDRRESIVRRAFARRSAWRRSALVLDVDWEPAGAEAGSRPRLGRLATAGKRSIRGERGEDASADLGDRRGAGIGARRCPWRNMATDRPRCSWSGWLSAWLGSSSATSWRHQATSVLIAQTVTCIWADGGSLDSRSSSSD
jgi:hypothetical protein